MEMKKTVSPRTIKIELTSEQREQLRKATGTEVAWLELTAEELEERIAPLVKVLDKSTPLLGGG
jgi:hypothetical protein